MPIILRFTCNAGGPDFYEHRLIKESFDYKKYGYRTYPLIYGPDIFEDKKSNSDSESESESFGRENPFSMLDQELEISQEAYENIKNIFSGSYEAYLERIKREYEMKNIQY